jgi:hypothetical protein
MVIVFAPYPHPCSPPFFNSPSGQGRPHYGGRPGPLGQGSPGRVTGPSQRPLPANTHSTHKTQTAMTQVGFKPSIPASELPQTHALDRAATGIATVVEGKNVNNSCG